MKKFLSVLFALLTVFALTTGVFAAETAYVTDALERVEADALKGFNEDAAKLKQTYGIGVFLAYVKGHADDVTPESLVGEEKDYVLLLMGERGTRIYTGGTADKIFSEEEDRNRLGYVHDEQDEWADGISRYLEVVEEYLEDATAEEQPETGTETIGALEENVPEESTSDTSSSDNEGGFHFGFAIPLIAAVLIAAIAIIFARKKKA